MERIGKYVLQGEIGRGGFGRVYKALDPTVGRVVAIKVLLPDATGADTLTRFKMEATTAGNLHHPNLVTVHEFGEENSNQYLVMEYLEGEDLQKILKEHRPMPLLDKIEIIQQVAAGLACAHDGGVIHRDVKPSNIMVLREGTVKVMDFGIARLARSDTTRFTQAGFLIGTLNYMSPEQFRESDVDHLCDIWAFGAICYEFVTGRFPFEGSSPPAILYNITTVDPPAPATLVPECPESLSQMIMKTLAKDRDLRYQSLSEFQLDLGPILMDMRRQRAATLLPEVRSLFAAQKGEEAQRLIRRVLDLDPLNTEARQLRERIQKLAQQQAIGPKVATLRQSGQEALAQGRYAEAIQSFEGALRLDSGNTDVRNLLETARGSVEKYKKAQEIADAAAKLADERDFTGAHEMVKQAIAVDPANQRAREVMTRVQHAFDSQERRREVDETLSRAGALAEAGSFDEAIALLSEAKQRLREPESLVEALKSFETRKQTKLEQERRQRALAEAAELLKQERADLAEQVLSTVRAESPDEPGLADLLAQCASVRAALKRREAVQKVVERVETLREDGELDRALALVDRSRAEFQGEPELDRLREQCVTMLKQRDDRRAIDDTLRKASDLRAAGKNEEALARLRDAAKSFGAVPALAELAAEIETGLQAKEKRRAIAEVLLASRAAAAKADFAGAAEMLRKAVAEFPGEPELTALLESAERSIGEAERRAQREAGLAQARELRASGDLAGAAARIRSLRDLHGDSPAMQDLDREILAEQQLRQKREAVQGTVAEARRRIAESQWEPAKALLRDALTLYPNEPELQSMLDGIERGLREQQARREKEEALKRSRVLEGQGKDGEAVAVLDAALALHPGDPELFSARAALAMRAVERQRAGDLTARLAGISQEIDKGRFERAGQDLEAVREQFGDNAEISRLADELNVKRRLAEQEAFARSIEQLIEQGKIAEAAAGLQQALAANPRDARLIRLRQVMEVETAFVESLQTIDRHLSARRLELAETALRSAAAMKPNHPEVNRLSARLRKDREKAASERVGQLKKAQDLTRKAGFDEANAILRSLVDLDPKDTEAIQALDALSAARAAHIKQQSYASRIADLEAKKRSNNPQQVKEGAGVLLAEFPGDLQAQALLSWADKRLFEIGAPKTPQGIAGWKVAIGGFLALALTAGAYFWITRASWNVSASKIAFTWTVGETLPDPKQLALSSAGSVVTLRAASGAPWLNVDPSQVVTPGQFSVAIAPASLAPGDYRTQVKIEAVGADPPERLVEVSLRIIGKSKPPQRPDAATISAEPSLLPFEARQGATAAETHTFRLQGRGVSRANISARSRGNWLSVSPALAVLPAEVTVQVTPSGLAPGSYQGEVTITGDGASERVNVSLRVRENERPAVTPPPPPPVETKKQPEPPKEAPIPAGTYAGPRRGTLTWVGELPPGQRLTIAREGPSLGTVNRNFPGDVAIRIEPATPGITVESAPAPANRYARAVLVNSSGAPVSLIQIRWFVQD